MRENMDKADVSRILKLAFLAPTIVSDILNGKQPLELTAQSLMKTSSNLPACWSLQKAYLGYTA